MAIIQVSNDVVKSVFWPSICEYWDEMIELTPIDAGCKRFGVIGHGAPIDNQQITMLINTGINGLSYFITWQ